MPLPDGLLPARASLPTHPHPRARRGNSYEPSDVKAALEYYSNGVGDMPYEADFAVNRFGTEDAAFFDDIDNNEGYAASEYLSVGIEEAAPKMKQVRVLPGRQREVAAASLVQCSGCARRCAALLRPWPVALTQPRPLPFIDRPFRLTSAALAMRTRPLTRRSRSLTRSAPRPLPLRASR
jgi:hypothetical protein